MRPGFLASILTILTVNIHPNIGVLDSVTQMQNGDSVRTATNTGYLPAIPQLLKQLRLAAFYNNIVEARLLNVLSSEGPFTVFAPTNAAFMAVPEWETRALRNATYLMNAMAFHVMSDEFSMSDIENEMLAPSLGGQNIRFNIYGPNKVTAQCSPLDLLHKDKKASNGVLHEITRMMVPPLGTIMDVVSSSPAFRTLQRALQFTGLAHTLSGTGPFTLFAPTQAAFGKLDPDRLSSLFTNRTLLTDILLDHVVNHTYCTSGLTNICTLMTFAGHQVPVFQTAGTLNIGNARVEIPDGADGSVTNGVLHAIDALIA